MTDELRGSSIPPKNTIAQLQDALAEVFEAYVEEFGLYHLADESWPAYRFQRAIEEARVLSGTPWPDLPIGDKAP